MGQLIPSNITVIPGIPAAMKCCRLLAQPTASSSSSSNPAALTARRPPPSHFTNPTTLQNHCISITSPSPSVSRIPSRIERERRSLMSSCTQLIRRIKSEESAIGVHSRVKGEAMRTKTTRRGARKLPVEQVGGQEEEQLVKMVCDAIDREVQSREEAIAAIKDGYMAGATAQLQLLMSTFPEHIRKMPMKRFLKQHCPDTSKKAKDSGTLWVGGDIQVGMFSAPS